MGTPLLDISRGRVSCGLLRPYQLIGGTLAAEALGHMHVELWAKLKRLPLSLYLCKKEKSRAFCQNPITTLLSESSGVLQGMPTVLKGDVNTRWAAWTVTLGIMHLTHIH
jgi:hypothetical protein